MQQVLGMYVPADTRWSEFSSVPSESYSYSEIILCNGVLWLIHFQTIFCFFLRVYIQLLKSVLWENKILILSAEWEKVKAKQT